LWGHFQRQFITCVSTFGDNLPQKRGNVPKDGVGIPPRRAFRGAHVAAGRVMTNTRGRVCDDGGRVCDDKRLSSSLSRSLSVDLSQSLSISRSLSRAVIRRVGINRGLFPGMAVLVRVGINSRLSHRFIRGSLFSFHCLAMTITAQMRLTSIINACVYQTSLPENERKIALPRSR